VASPRIAIIGAGMSGVCVAVKLKQAGFHDITLFDKGDDIGGTWRETPTPAQLRRRLARLLLFVRAERRVDVALPEGPR